MLILSLPKGIAAFVVIVAGLAISLPLSAVLIGIPLLAFTLMLSRTIMLGEGDRVAAWLQGRKLSEHANVTQSSSSSEHQSWRSWLASIMKDGQSYRGILFGLLQLPISVLMFTFAIVLPVTALAVLLSPAAYEVSMRLFAFDLFADDWRLNHLFNWSLTSAERSWIAGGVGLVFTVLVPFMLKGLGRWYSAWIVSIAGHEPAVQVAEQAKPVRSREMYEYLMSLGEEVEVDQSVLRPVRAENDGDKLIVRA